MNEAVALIDRIIEEHRTIGRRLESLEQVANDAEALVGLDKVKEAFTPGRFDQSVGLQKLKELLDAVEQALKAHFGREETGLMAAFENQANRDLSSAFRSLLLEHEDLKNRFAEAKRHISELTGGGLSRHVWEASAHDMQAHISHTRKLLAAHAAAEQELLHELRRILVESEGE